MVVHCSLHGCIRLFAPGVELLSLALYTLIFLTGIVKLPSKIVGLIYSPTNSLRVIIFSPILSIIKFQIFENLPNEKSYLI